MRARGRAVAHRAAILVLVLALLAGTVLAIRLLWQQLVDRRDIALLLGLYLPISLGITFGTRPFHTSDRSRNQWLVGLLAFGEGWHNNHHAFPRSALRGQRWWQVDLSGLTIRMLACLRLIGQVERISAAEIHARHSRTLLKNTA